MTWQGGVWNTDGTDITQLAAGVNIYYDKRFLNVAKNTLRLTPFGQTRDIPLGTGNVVQFFRYNNISISALGAYLTDGTNPDPTALTGQDISSTIAEWGNFSQHSRLLSDTHIDRKLNGVIDLWGEHAGSTIDLLSHMAVCSSGAYPFRCDGNNSNGSFYFSGTVDSSDSTSITDSAFGGNLNFGDFADDGNQSVVVITSGTGYGQARPCTGSTTPAGQMTVSPAWDVNPGAGDNYVIVSAHGLVSTDVMTTANIRSAVALLRNNKAATVSSGYYVGILSPDTEATLMADTNWENVMQYRDNPEIKVNGLFSGEVGIWGGVRWVRTTQPFRFPIAAITTANNGVGAFVPGTSYTNYSATGAVYSNLILGKEAFGVTTLKGNSVMKPGIIVKRSGPSDTGNPLNRFSTVGWYLPFIAKGLNPLYAVQMWSGG